jgi:thiol-disulfide isomerase/thioredoxin
MKMLLILMTAMFGLFAAPNGHAQTVSNPTVVLFYADWCGSCKILEPKLKKAMSTVKSSTIKQVVFDMTDDATKAKSMEMAKKRGLMDVYDAYAPKTGMAILVNDSGREVTTLKKNQSVEDMELALKSLDGNQS